MTLYKRGNIWWVTYMVDGVRYQQSTHARRKSDAQAWVDCITTARKAPTFEDAVEILRRLFRAESATPGIPLDYREAATRGDSVRRSGDGYDAAR